MSRAIRRPRTRYASATASVPEQLKGMTFADPSPHVQNEAALARDLGLIAATEATALAALAVAEQRGGTDKVTVGALYARARRLFKGFWCDGREALTLARADSHRAYQRENQPFSQGVRMHRGQFAQRQRDCETSDEREREAEESCDRLMQESRNACDTALQAGPEPYVQGGVALIRCDMCLDIQQRTDLFTPCFCRTQAYPTPDEIQAFIDMHAAAGDDDDNDEDDDIEIEIGLGGDFSKWLLALPLPETRSDLRGQGAVSFTGLEDALRYFGTKNAWHLTLLSQSDLFNHHHHPLGAWRDACKEYTCNYGAFATKIQRVFRARRLRRTHQALQMDTTLDPDVSRYCVCAYLGM
jgi:hypothetical protein